MKRLLVVVELSARTQALCSEVQRRAEQELVEVFVLCPCFSPAPLRQLRRAGRFWQEAHARLDALLQELCELGIVADGIVSEAAAPEAIAGLAPSFAPSEVLIAMRGRGQRYRRRLELALAARAGDVPAPAISWCSS